jgi:glycine/D-amino acid oxidase-like deaminating enzyme
MTVNYTRIGVVGAGAMGRGIAQIAAQAGSEVLLLDSFAGAAERGREALAAQWNKLHEKGKIDAPTRDAYVARVKAVDGSSKRSSHPRPRWPPTPRRCRSRPLRPGSRIRSAWRAFTSSTRCR